MPLNNGKTPAGGGNMYIRPSGPPRTDRGGARRPRALCVGALMSLLTSLVFGVFLTAEAEALDPNRTLTQALLRKWQVQQGLPQATILSILQTADHYLWLGTPS